MNFIVKTIGKSFHNWNFQEVDTPLNPYIYMKLIPYENSRLDLGKDFILCGDNYYDKEIRSENRDEQFLNSKIISEVSISIFNYDELDDESKSGYKDNCGLMIHDGYYVGIQIALRNDVFKEVENNILLNKFINNFSVRFKNHNEKDDVSFGSSPDGSHSVWTKENEEQKRLDVEDYNISFSLYELTESLTWQERQDEEDRKQRLLMNTIEQAILYANEKTKMDQGARLFNELKPYLIGIVLLLTAITTKLIF